MVNGSELRLWRQRAGRDHRGELARISHHLTVEARDRPAITSLRLLAVLTVLSEAPVVKRGTLGIYETVL